MRKFNIFFVLLVFSSLSFGQFSTFKNNPFSNTIILGLGAGVSQSRTDYSESDLGLTGISNAEYYFKSNSPLFLGFKLRSEYSTLKGSTTTSSFEQDVISLGPSLIAKYQFSRKVYPYIGLGIKNVWFEDLTSLSLTGEMGIKYLLTKYFALSGNISFNFLGSDELDGLKVDGSDNDFYASFSIGISYAVDLTVTDDIDGDAILNFEDKCPELEEDFDGFEDNDGCPEFDNDNDGIVDLKDNCSDLPEDFDGYEDHDGCPDPDNDNDGIDDENDTCQDLKEDFDGFEDDDGCPELDNDGDGIIDSNDKCPDQSETFNNFEDADGCPDTVPEQIKIEEEKVESEKQKNTSKPERKIRVSIPNEFLLQGDDIFINHSSKIKSSAHSSLNEIADQLKYNNNFKWRIEGHLDNSGTPRELKILSTSRANAILNYFISRGLPPALFTAVGMADQVPIAPNSTLQGKILNRRIKIKRIR